MNQNQDDDNDDEIEREICEQDETNKKQEHRIRNLETKTLQNVNLYFIFQAVILASTTMTVSSTGCHNWWIPFTLSLLAAVTNLISYCGDVSRILNSREELDQDILDLAFIKLYRIRRAQVKQVLPGTTLSHRGREMVRVEVEVMKRWKRWLIFYLFVGLFVGFSVVLMYGCYSILCRSAGRKCVKLC